MESTRNAVIETERMFHALDGQFFGKYRGLVVDNTDPTYRGRLQVKVPAVMGEETLWAEPCAPYAGDGVGFFALPPANAGVWVEFEAGDPRYPIWSGCFWACGQIDAADAAPSIKFFKTDSFTIRIDDEQGRDGHRNNDRLAHHDKRHRGEARGDAGEPSRAGREDRTDAGVVQRQ